VPRVPPDPAFRAHLEARAIHEGPQPLLDELAKLDPEYYGRVDPKNLRRVIRALEVYHRTGVPISSCQTRQPLECTLALIGLSCERETLYYRIDDRVDAMFQSGFVDEVQRLVGKGYHCDLPAMSGIGYRQVCQHLAGRLSLDDAIALTKTQTHRLARAQRAWFRQDDDRIQWLDAMSPNAPAEALRLVESKLSQ
jgi:tRNA dimethylallyltransferase